MTYERISVEMVNHLNQALNVDELSDLEDKLKRIAGLDIFHAQGFLYAIICTPEQAKPSDWFPLLFKAEIISKHEAQMTQIASYLTRLAYQIRTNISTVVFRPNVSQLNVGCHQIMHKPMLDIDMLAPLPKGVILRQKQTCHVVTINVTQ